MPSTRQSHAALAAPGSEALWRGSRGARGAPQEPWARRGRWRGVLRSVLPMPAQNAVYSSYPPNDPFDAPPVPVLLFLQGAFTVAEEVCYGTEDHRA
jgi:hypothetical protein